MTNEYVTRMARELRRASAQHQAPIWKALSEHALKSSTRTTNIRDISRLTRDGDAVAFPGKVLGTGGISHRITLFCFGISESAAGKVVEAGGRIVDHGTMISERPTGQGVVLLG